MKDDFDLTKEIKELTEDYQYGSELMLLLHLSDINMRAAIDFFKLNDIRGYRLDNFYYVCKGDQQVIKDTIQFLNYGFITKDEIVYNLDSLTRCTPFIDRPLKELFTGDSYLDDDLFQMMVARFRNRLNEKRR